MKKPSEKTGTEVVGQSLRYRKKILAYLLNTPCRFYHWGRYGYLLIKNAADTAISSRTHKLPKLEHMVFEVTDACNSRCKHCYIWRHSPTRNILTPEEVEKLLHDDFFSNVKTVLLTGGEAILRKDIDELIASIHRSVPQAEITLSTNGLLPDRVLEVVNRAVLNNIPLSIGLSLDAIGEKHDLIRGVKGSFEKTDYLLAELIKIKERVGKKMGIIAVGYTLSNLTADTLEEVYVYVQRLKMSSFLIQLYEEFPFYHNIERGKDFSLKNYQKSDNKTLINLLKKQPPSFHNEMLLSALRHRLRFRCAAMRTFFLLRCDGSISPCLRLSDISAGNIRQQSFQKIWFGEPTEQVRTAVANCKGCSNSWGTSWSFESWFIPFFKLRVILMWKNFVYRMNNPSK